MHRTHHFAAFVLLLMLALGGCGDDASTSGDGAATPEAFVARAAALSKANDVAAMVPLVLPKQRAFFSYMIGVFPGSMAVGFAAMGDEAKAKAMKEGWEALLKEHGIDESKMEDDDDAKGPPNPEKFHELMGDVDHQAFLRAALAFLDKHSDKKESKAQRGMPKFSPEDATIDVKGDRATVTVNVKDDGKERPLTLVKSNGRWYMDMMGMMGK